MPKNQVFGQFEGGDDDLVNAFVKIISMTKNDIDLGYR